MYALSELRKTDIRTVDPETLIDIRDISIDPNLPKAERLREYIRQIKNPYCYKCGKIIVKAGYKDTGATIEDRLKSLLVRMLTHGSGKTEKGACQYQ